MASPAVLRLYGYLLSLALSFYLGASLILLPLVSPLLGPSLHTGITMGHSFVNCNSWQLREQNKGSLEDLGLALPLTQPPLPGDGCCSRGKQGPVPSLTAVPGPLPALPSTWHRDPGEGLRLAQRVHLDVPECLAHGALQVPATQGDTGESLGLVSHGSLWDRSSGCGPILILALPGNGGRGEA